MERSKVVTEELIFQQNIRGYIYSVIESAVRKLKIDEQYQNDLFNHSDESTASVVEREQMFKKIRNDEYNMLIAAVKKQDKRKTGAFDPKQSKQEVYKAERLHKETKSSEMEGNIAVDVAPEDDIGYRESVSTICSVDVLREYRNISKDIFQYQEDRRNFIRRQIDRIFKRNKIFPSAESMKIALNLQNSLSGGDNQSLDNLTEVLVNHQLRINKDSDCQNIRSDTGASQTRKTGVRSSGTGASQKVKTGAGTGASQKRKTGVGRLFYNLTSCFRPIHADV